MPPSIRAAVRSLRRAPALVAAVVLSLALGIGANTTVYSWLDSMVLHPYPAVRAPDDLVAIAAAAPDGETLRLSYPAAREWAAAATGLEGLAVWTGLRVGLRRGDDAEASPSWIMPVSGNYFAVLGVPTVLGRALSERDEAERATVAVVSHDAWRRRFGGDSALVGSTVFLNGRAVTIVGVARPGFSGTYVGVTFDLWVPVTIQPLLGGGPPGLLDDRAFRWLQGVGRRAPGVTVAQARSSLDAAARRAAEAAGDRPVVGARVLLMREQFLGSIVFPLFTALLVTTALILVIACANLANLLLARAVARHRETGVRLALGATRRHLVSQGLAESAVLASLGGAAGLAVAALAQRAFLLFIPPVAFDVRIPLTLNWRVAAVAAAASAFTAVAIGLAPALRAARADALELIRGVGAPARTRLRSALVVTQVALSMVVLVAAGLFVRSLQRAARADLGFVAPDRLLLVGVDLRLASLPDSLGPATTARLLERIRALPGVASVSAATMVPLGFGGHRGAPVRVEGREARTDENTDAERVLVGAGYVSTMGARLVAGREIGEADAAGAARVAVVNEAFVRRFWPDGQALGRRLDHGDGWATVVGVVADAPVRNLEEPITPIVYSPLAQRPQAAFTIHLRTRGPAGPLESPVRRAFGEVAGDLPALEVRTLAEHAAAATLPQRIGAAMLGAFGALALLMAAVGLSGVLAFVVAQRAREIGIRRALGAGEARVVALVVRQAARLLLAGVGVGAVGALGVGRLIAARVSVAPADPVVFGIVVLVLGGAGVAAAWAPARRAARVDPMVAMRAE